MNVLSLYFVEESDPFQEKDFFTKIEAALSASGQKPEMLQLDTKTTSVEEILESANSFSMFASKRLILVTQSKEITEDQEAAILQYLQNPSPMTTLIWKLKKLDKRKKFTKQIQSMGCLIQFSKPKPGEMGPWIDRIAASLKISVARDAKPILIENMGTNLALLQHELEKLSLYIHPKTTIERADVELMISKSTGEDIFAFTDAVIQKNSKRALSSLQYLLSEGTVPLVLLSMILRHIRILMKIHQGLHQKVPTSALASFVGIPPFLVQRYVDQSRTFSVQDCDQAISLLQSADRDFKSTGLSNRFILERTMISLMTAKRSQSSSRVFQR